MKLIGIYIKWIRFLLHVIDGFSKFACAFSLKYKEAELITKLHQMILDESGCKPIKILVDKGTKFYDRSSKSWLKDNHIKLIEHIIKKNQRLLNDS